MIKVRLYSHQERMDTNRCPANGGEKSDHLYVGDGWDCAFWHILCPTLLDEEEAGKAPFRDAESVQFLKDTYGIVFANEEDWHSVICEGTRMNIACLNKAILCGLGAIYRSKRGLYSWCNHITARSGRRWGISPWRSWWLSRRMI